MAMAITERLEMSAHHNSGTWEQLHGAKRRAIDRQLLAECERQIAQEERRVVNSTPQIDREDAHRRIALAFGRPLR